LIAAKNFEAVQESHMSSNVSKDSGNNVYAPPAARIGTSATLPDVSDAPFYIVSSPKMLILFFATAGWYTFYWFWRHWSCYKARTNHDIWPMPRAFFSIFTAHTLNELIASRIKKNNVGYVWSPGFWASLYVLAAIEQPFAILLARYYLSPTLSLVVNVIGMALAGLALLQTQRAANRACGDAAGATNRRITASNVLWIVIGMALWIYSILTIIPHEFMWMTDQ
jgi:hypothetical protein